jgi:transposase InsO family protein
MTFEQYADLQHFAHYHQTGKMSTDFIAKELSKTPQHVRRLFKRLNEPPKKRFAWNKISLEARQFVIETKKEKANYNCQWISEIASERFDQPISQSSVWRILNRENLLNCPAPQRKVRSRFEAEKSGDLVQMDTTWGYWWEGKKLCLILLLDDYSRLVLHAKFVLHDTAEANMNMIRETVEKYGTFKLLYTDNASFFKAIRHGQSRYQHHSQEEYESNITKSCRELGITHITHKPYEPQGKGKIERLFRFIQERLIEDIADDQGHIPFYVLQKKLNRWVDWYNKKHVNRTTHKTPKERFDPSGFLPLPADKCLDDIFCIKDTRVVDKCNGFSYHGQIYTIPKDKNMTGYRVHLHVLPERSIRVWHMDELICVKDIKRKLPKN